MGHQESEDGTDSDAGNDGWVGVGADGGVGGVRALDCLVASSRIALFDCRPEALPGLGDILAGNVCRRSQKRAGITGQLLDVVANRVGLVFEGWMGRHGILGGHSVEIWRSEATEKDEDKDDDDQKSEAAAGVVAPTLAVGPGGEGAQEQEDEDDE